MGKMNLQEIDCLSGLWQNLGQDLGDSDASNLPILMDVDFKRYYINDINIERLKDLYIRKEENGTCFSSKQWTNLTYKQQNDGVQQQVSSKEIRRGTTLCLYLYDYHLGQPPHPVTVDKQFTAIIDSSLCGGQY